MTCPKCGKYNADGAKFCQGCGAPLTSSATRPNVKETTPPPPPPGPTSYYSQYGSMLQPPQKPKNRGMLIALIVSGIVVVGLAIFLGFMLAGTQMEKDYDTTALSLYSDNVPAESPDSVMVIATEETPAVAAPAAPAAPAESKVAGGQFKAKGTIDGYPFHLSGKWKSDERATGTYYNDYNGVKMSFTAEIHGDSMYITLTKGKNSVYMDLEKKSDSRYEGSYQGYKHVILTLQ